MKDYSAEGKAQVKAESLVLTVSKSDSGTTLGHCFSPETPIFDTLQISKRGLTVIESCGFNGVLEHCLHRLQILEPLAFVHSTFIGYLL